MPKDNFVGTPPNRSHFKRQKKCRQLSLIRPIARGSFSHVFLSKDPENGDAIAVKVMDLLRFETEFELEVNMLMSLTHQGINVGYRSSEIDEDDNAGYIYLDFIPLPTLSEYIEQSHGGIKETQAILIFQSLIDAVEEIHSCHVAHKDLKPENIFVDPTSNKVKVIDFGLSVLALENELFDSFCGSPLYMPPEVLNKEVYNPISADIWGLGIIFYEMLLGKNPWSSAENIEDLVEIISQELKFPSFISSESSSLLYGLLAYNPSNRINIEQIKAKISSLLAYK